MRRLAVLLIVALVGAAAFGVWSSSSALSVDGTSLSSSALRGELGVIASSSTLDCYLSALSPSSFAPGAGGSSVGAAGAAAWMSLRVEGLAISHYVSHHFSYQPSATDLAAAQSSLEGELTQAATSSQLTCPGTSAQALADMTPEMRTAQIRSQADSLYLLKKLNSTIPLTAANIKAYYNAHVANYDTICVSVAVVPTSDVAKFAKDQKAGMSVADLARKYSLDSSKTKGGAYGCYSPSSSAYATVRADTLGTTLNTFPSTPRGLQSNGTVYALYVAPTKRTTTPFATAQATVVSDMQSQNASSANAARQTILEQALVRVDPAFGTWSLTSSGPAIAAPSAPPAGDVSSASLLTTAPTSSYQ